MSDIVIKVENLGKLYRLGEIGTGTISHDLNRWWARVRGKEDPFAKVGEANDRTTKGNGDYVWALNNVSFEVKQGEVLGIVGRNGAGKSTLLKILSKVTTPSKGSIKVKGRIASLLEVGTGFHPELTGRENIFLNGAILGMTKQEIRSKFDEIVDFAGVERYIDTPVKRYSSGMYVRLAFAVAAFLEPEILIVDEVLAVGDAEFQEKCIGRMKDVSNNDGRTVLFVSHNLAAVNKLCKRGLLLTNGNVDYSGGIIEVVDHYVNSKKSNKPFYSNNKSSKSIYINEVGLLKAYNKDVLENTFLHNEDIILRISIDNSSQLNRYTIGIALLDNNQEKIFTNHYEVTNQNGRNINVVCRIPGNLLNQGGYSFDIALFQKGLQIYEYLKDICRFDVLDAGSELFYQAGEKIGPIRVNCQWNIL